MRQTQFAVNTQFRQFSLILMKMLIEIRIVVWPIRSIRSEYNNPF